MKRCPIEFTLSLINGKWKLIILKELSQGALRYGELLKCIPTVSAKVLIQQVRELERDGLVTRKIFPEVPPRVEYALSDKGTSIFTIFVEMYRWGLTAGDDEVECRECKKCQPYIAASANG